MLIDKKEISRYLHKLLAKLVCMRMRNLIFFLLLGFSSPIFALSSAEQNDFLIALASSISVKKYPAQIQEIKPLFDAKCLSCHGIKETVKSPEVLPSYWVKTVEKMRLKPKASFTPEEGEKIAEFLIYDSYFRRRMELKKELKALPEEQLKEEQKILDRVINKYND